VFSLGLGKPVKAGTSKYLHQEVVQVIGECRMQFNDDLFDYAYYVGYY
jgi:hypothetical protein